MPMTSPSLHGASLLWIPTGSEEIRPCSPGTIHKGYDACLRACAQRSATKGQAERRVCMELVAYTGPVSPEAALRDRVAPTTDIHSLFVNKPTSSIKP